MEKSKKIKIILGLFYIIIVSSILYFFFSKFTFQELTSYEFIKNNRDFFFNLKQSNLIMLSLFFLLAAIFWVFAAGFALPLALLSGFIFDKWLGTLLVTLGMSIGATCLYIFGNFFLKEFVKKKFLDKYKNLESKFKKSEFIYLLMYRFIGGIPFALSNIVPCIFNVKISNFFLATLIGLTPQLFLIVSIGSGLEKIINENLEPPKISDIVYSPDIYIPIITFGILIILTIIARKFFYKK